MPNPLPLPPPGPPPAHFPARWAGDWGEDPFGLWQSLIFRGVRQVFRWMPPGRFLMGSPDDERKRMFVETRHPVLLTQGFWLADTACTQALWRAVMDQANPSAFKDDPENPVENVSWHEVQEFLSRLNTLVPGLDARLPTEAEWEYACRAGTTTPFSFGPNITPEQVNYNGDYPYVGGKKGLYREKTVPVRSLPANPWGLYEMHGNVWEWCADWFGSYPLGEAIDPSGPLEREGRVLRGGSGVVYGRFARSARRDVRDPYDRSDFLGFRFASGGKGTS